MINPEKAFNILDYLEIFLRRIWYIVIPFVLIMTGAVLYALNTPKMYRAGTLILVTPQKVPEAFVRPTVTLRIEDRLQSIGQEIMSRTRLEQIISEFKLYSEQAKSLSREEIVEMMRKNIIVEIKGKEGYFTISYVGGDPRTVTMVTNKLASLFIEENLKLREQQAQGTSEFLSIELQSTKAKVEEQEKAITQFKRQHMAELPEQREANLRVLDQLQKQYQGIGDALRAAQDRRLIIQKQIADIKQLQLISPPSMENLIEEEAPAPAAKPASSPTPLPSAPRHKPDNPYEVQLRQLTNQLMELRGKYTEKHPDIVKIKRNIADVEEKLKASVAAEKAELAKLEKFEEKELASPSIVASSPAPPPKRKSEKKMEIEFDPSKEMAREMESQLAALDLDIRRLKEEESRTRAKIAEYQGRVENTPIRELGMSNLTRDYQNTKDSYQSLMKKSQEAQQAENLERRQKGEQFKVIDPARLPEKPFKPDVPKTLLFGLLLALGCGFGMAFLKEQMDHSYRDPEDLEASVGFKVLANIPKIEARAT
jgi:polysaccharide chain length determinant protein (PEP-CTERM system associated)